ncbi:swarming motility protein SwrC [Flavobacteriaceae bacterium UJ101]|nr:swarming motility protein SwrC [Flavobacteriaceae bacterium UJ101]
MSDQNTKKEKQFGLSTWAINNRMTIYVMMALFLFMGESAYYNMARENFPEIIETKIYVSSLYAGNTAEDVEKLITDPLEEELKNISNVVEVTSTSQEDYSIITIEFDENISVESAKQKVKDEVDVVVADPDWPLSNGAKVEPNVFDLNMSEEQAIMNINLYGDYTTKQLKDYAELLQDEIETIPEIKEASIRGAQELEVEVAVDIYKMMGANVSFDNVINAINNGNLTVSGGNLISNKQRRNIRVIGEIERPSDLENFVVKSQNGAVYLKDIATISFKEEDKTTYAREMGNQVVMLDVKKRSGKNMVDAVEQVYEKIKEGEETYLPSDLKITVANDQKDRTVNQVDDLVNNIIFGVILVVGVLMFFLGFRNALFVGFAIPMSMFISFMILQMLGFTLNTMVLFAMVMGLGMLVDNGIVVVENVYSLMDERGMSAKEAAIQGVSEIAFPIIISTATTVAAFIPLGLWPGTMGQFMIYFPKTLSIVLGSSLFVAIFFNSMLTAEFMKTEEGKITNKALFLYTAILVGTGVLAILFGKLGSGVFGFGALLIFAAVFLWLYRFLLEPAANFFQNRILTWMERVYKSFLSFALKGWHAIAFLIGTFALLVFSIMLVGMAQPKVEFFPENKPNQIITYIEYPQGTDIEKTNAITKDVEKKIFDVLKQYTDDDGYNYMVESAVSQVGEGAGNPQTDGGSTAEMPHKGKITVSMREYKYRRGVDSEDIQKQIQEAVKGYPGVSITVEKDAAGPPAGYPVNIEITGNDYDELIITANDIKNYIENTGVDGIEDLRLDVTKSKPGIQVEVDRKKAGELGVAVGQVGLQIRRSLYGEKSGTYKKDGDDYDIYVRFNEENRYNINSLFNQQIVFRDQLSGQLKQVPLSAVTEKKNVSSFTAIKHRDLKRVVTVYSDVLPGYNATEIVNQLKGELKGFKTPNGVKFSFTGEMEEQEDNMMFLLSALASGLGLIMLLLVFQFNSISKPTIIMIAIFLSFIGVFLGLVISGKPFVIMMTMMGIISLAGIVVNNGVVLLDYTELLISRKKHELQIPENIMLPKEHIYDAIVAGGVSRLRPVLLTAITTVLGLMPLAVGLNIDFFGLFKNLNPNIYFGGDNVIFWGPLAWTVIYGLTFATFLTLIIVPVMYYLVNQLKLWYRGKQEKKKRRSKFDDYFDDKAETGLDSIR